MTVQGSLSAEGREWMEWLARAFGLNGMATSDRVIRSELAALPPLPGPEGDDTRQDVPGPENRSWTFGEPAVGDALEPAHLGWLQQRLALLERERRHLIDASLIARKERDKAVAELERWRDAEIRHCDRLTKNLEDARTEHQKQIGGWRGQTAKLAKERDEARAERDALPAQIADAITQSIARRFGNPEAGRMFNEGVFHASRVARNWDRS